METNKGATMKKLMKLIENYNYKPPMGWQCPVCGMVMSPFTTVCVNSPHIKTIVSTSTKIELNKDGAVR